MARQPGNFTDAERYLYSRWYDPSLANVLHDINNNTPLTWASQDDNTSYHALSLDTDNIFRIDRGCLMGSREPMTFYLAAAGTMVTQVLFTADRPIAITDVLELHSTAETATGTATLTITKDSPGMAPGAGVAVISNTFNLKATANTLQTGTLLAVTATGNGNAGLTLAKGDRLTAVVGGTATITALAGVVVTVWAAPGFKEVPAICQMNLNALITTQTFFTANRDYKVIGISATWSHTGTSAVVDVTVDTGTTAPGGGSSLLATTFDGTTAINTPQFAALTATTSRLTLRAGNRLAVKPSGTLTGFAGLVVVVYLQSTSATGYIGQVDVAWTMKADASLATQGMFIADRDYEGVDWSAVWSTANGGASTLDLTIDKGAVAPGAGTSMLTGTSDLTTTANTVSFPGITTVRHNRLISRGDLVSPKFTGTLSALVGVTGTLSMLPR